MYIQKIYPEDLRCTYTVMVRCTYTKEREVRPEMTTRQRVTTPVTPTHKEADMATTTPITRTVGFGGVVSYTIGDTRVAFWALGKPQGQPCGVWNVYNSGRWIGQLFEEFDGTFTVKPQGCRRFRGAGNRKTMRGAVSLMLRSLPTT